MNPLKILPTSLLLTLTLSILTSAQAQNRTFTLTAFNTTNPAINGKQIMIAPPNGYGSVEVNVPSGPNAVPLVAFIWNNNLYRYCQSSPTGVCIGQLSKAYAGALTGWYFDFSDKETPVPDGPTPPIIGVFSLQDDYEYPSPDSKWPCKPTKPTKVKVLAHGLDNTLGSTGWTACDLGQPGTGVTNGYGFNSIPVPTFAHNGPMCAQYDIKMKIGYTN